ncbi:MAG: caspase family protein [Bacteroidetes bacterium]|nr:caspase family protein [Bacteroidota bacterium]
MNKRILHIVFFILIMTMPFQLQSQVVESEWSKIHINNKKVETKVLLDTISPTIHLISPHVKEGNVFKTDQEKFTLIGKTSDNSGGLTLLVNSKNVIPSSSGLFKQEIDLKKGINKVNIIAIDLEENISEKTVNIEYSPTYEYTENIDVKGDYYALLIAVEEYQHPKLFNLQNPVYDATALKEVLTTKYLFDSDNINLLTNPTRDEVINSFDKLSQELTENDNLLVFYAGHGWWDKDANIGYWLPADADKTSKVRWVRNSTVQDYLKEIKAKHMLLVTDACFSGSIFNARSISTGTSVAIKKLYELPSRKAMTSGSLTEVPDESIFVKYFIDRLDKNEKQFLSAEQLFSSFRIAVINNSEALPQYGVIKNVGDEGGDFIFILRNP